MHPRTPSVAEALRRRKTPSDRLAVLGGAYRGETCVIVTGGPSLDDHNPGELRRVLDGTLTIAVKQAIDRVGEQADFLCFNLYNARKFRVPRPETIRVFVDDPDSRARQRNRADLTLALEPGADLMADSVAATGAWGQWELSHTPVRPRGPGIMYELVLYLAVHLGVSRIVTVGWDVAAPDGSNRHFGDEEAPPLSGSREPLPTTTTRARLRRLVPDRPARAVATAVRHEMGRTYNPARMQSGEAELVARGSRSAADWLAFRDVELVIVSDRSWIDQSVPRVTLAGVHDSLRSTAPDVSRGL